VTSIYTKERYLISIIMFGSTQNSKEE